MTRIEVTGAAQERAWQTGVLPEVERVRDRLWSIPVPIPNNPLRYVLVYLLELDDGVAVIDTGWPHGFAPRPAPGWRCIPPTPS